MTVADNVEIGIPESAPSVHGSPSLQRIVWSSVIGTAVEGLTTIVRNGRNGYLFERKKFEKEAPLKVQDVMEDFESNYVPLFHSSLEEYRQRLNWQSAVREIKPILQDLIRG